MRRQKSNWRSFGHGFMLAGLPLLAFATADYLFAPPSGSVVSESVSRSAAVGSRLAEGSTSFGAPRLLREPDGPAFNADGGKLLQTAVPSQPVPVADDPNSRLVNSIQKELRRVGCYAGDADGSWTDHTKVAMRAFNDSVHVSLGTDQPDYILLTLLQGHNGKACSRPCDGALNAGTQCIDKTIEARRIPPATLVTRQAAIERAGQVSVSSVASTTPASARSSMAPAVRAAPASPVDRYEATRDLANTVAQEELSRAKEKSEPLPGRMAVGAPSATEPDRAEVVVSESSAVAEAAPRIARARPEPVARPSVAPSSGAARVRQHFSELSRNSP